MNHYVTTRGEDCLIVYHPSRGAIERARIRRYFRLRFATLRAFIFQKYERN